MLLIPETPYFPPPTILYTILLYSNTDTVDMCDTCQPAAEVFSCSKLLPRTGSDCVATHPAAILGMYVSMYSHHFYRTDWASTYGCQSSSWSTFFSSFFFFNLTYSRWTSSLPSCLWSQRIFPSLPGSRLTISYRDASSALLQLVNQWLNFTYSRSHAFRYERKNTNPTLVRIELTTSALAGVQVNY